MKDVCGNLAETFATADLVVLLVVLEVGVVGEEADDLVSPVAVVPEWWVFVAFAAVVLATVLAAFMITFFCSFFFSF